MRRTVVRRAFSNSLPASPVTVPGTTPELASPLSPPPAEPLFFPFSWLTEHASEPLKYRAITEVAQTASPASADISALPYACRPAIRLAVTQSSDGMWNNSVLSLPGKHATEFANIGTIPAVRRLLEYGWAQDSPPLIAARRLLFRLLAEDNDPAFTFELGTKAKDEDTTRRTRGIFREAAAATLAQMGYENDPRLRGAARRLVERTIPYVNSP